MAESQSYERSQYNLAADGHRQPGSTFKAIDLADALSRGDRSQHTYYHSHTLDPGWLPGYPTYEVKTFEGTSLNKSINLVNATLTSDNTVYAQLAADLGERRSPRWPTRWASPRTSRATRRGARRAEVGVTPLEMADVYATLADGGWRNKPIAITKVVFPDGHVDRELGQAPPREVLSEGGDRRGDEILAAERPGGTATRSAINCPTAAKTGTTSELVDAWLDGYTPELLDGRVDGLPEQARLDDRRPRRAAAGRLPARGNLARLHGGGDRRQPRAPVPASTKDSDHLPALLGRIRQRAGSPQPATALRAPGRREREAPSAPRARSRPPRAR